ncbi:uncharacterized protein N7473_003018 [Penicillium subrubescens]|uniref:Uncharacterized protein n=1 Tax=Penicillium subrubescens TaxID=1316194 RepID=A0A1Q5TDR7_9EURO|nr:uncharacterized protein N7473_003018 [Penicillium subrubescens]KAJ5906102.1 hypothetical protein N7473_003018 [Penicillium subrubescens]OKO98364.1 hypothetical protein PENSUB_9462 [Penicillium subrubescens]
MPTNTSSPVKRPGLGRRAVSSHAVVTRTNANAGANPNELSQSHSSRTTTVHHKPHRAHVVGGGHRNHHRNPSLGKNLNKLQRFQLGPETSGRNHQRKKSAPATPIGSPKGQAHVHWAGAVDDHPKDHWMKRNYSTPILRRNNSAAIVKKTLVTERPHSSAGKKKSVGFELGDDDENDDAEWEDTTQSPESTRRNSVAPSNHSADNNQVLVDPLTFVKRPYPQISRATSLPDSITSKLVREREYPDLDHEHDDEEEEEDEEENSDDTQRPGQPTDQGDIANRLLSPSHSAKAPPAMSSISAMAKPSDSTSRSTSLNLTGGLDAARRTFSTSNLGMAQMPGSQPGATSSSMEGGVSRFIMSNKSGLQSSSRTDSDPNTPSSFLPHYHPQTPPSPNRANGKSTASPARPRGVDLPSRTQQKLWLQRTATLNNSPPDSHGVPTTVSPSNMDTGFVPGGHSRGGSTFDGARSMNGSGRAGVLGHDTEARQIRKAYEKISLELMVARRFQSPTADSFYRLRTVARASAVSAENASALGKPVQSAPSLPLLQRGNRPTHLGSSAETKSQLPDPHSSASEDPATHSESTDTTQAAPSSHPSHRILSTSDEAAHGLTGDHSSDDFPALSENDLMIRRMWETREVATSG